MSIVSNINQRRTFGEVGILFTRALFAGSMIVALSAAGVLAWLHPQPSSAGGPPLLGDVNCDSSINSIDATFLLQLTAGLIATVPCPENADPSGDGEANSLDAALILQFSAGLIDAFGPTSEVTPPQPPSTPEPTIFSMTFERMLPSGSVPGSGPETIFYDFRVTGALGYDLCSGFSIDAPYSSFANGQGHGECSHDDTTLRFHVDPWFLSTGTQTASIELSDGRRADAQFPHVRTTNGGRPFPPCSSWLPRVEEVLTLLPVPDGSCLVKFDNPADWPEWKCAPCPPLFEVWCQTWTPADDGQSCDRDGVPGGDLDVQGHDMCHLHQVWHIMNEGLYRPGDNPTQPWMETSQGIAFLDVSTKVLADYKLTGLPLPWPEFGTRTPKRQPVEDFANICSAWLLPRQQHPSWLEAWPLLIEFAESWLPDRGAMPEPSYECSLWPDEVAEVLQQLSVPDGLCLLRVEHEDDLPAELNCSFGCYHPNQRVAVCVSVCAPPVGGETAAITHEVCHAHQHQNILDHLMRELAPQEAFDVSWLQTPPGVNFLELGTWEQADGEWVELPEEGWSGYPRPHEDAANVCAVWFSRPLDEGGTGGPEYLRDFAPIRYEWAQAWLPAPAMTE